MKKEKKGDGNLESNQECKKAIAERIGRPLKYPSRNEEEEYEDKDKERSPWEEDNEDREDKHEDDSIYNCYDAMLYNA